MLASLVVWKLPRASGKFPGGPVRKFLMARSFSHPDFFGRSEPCSKQPAVRPWKDAMTMACAEMLTIFSVVLGQVCWPVCLRRSCWTLTAWRSGCDDVNVPRWPRWIVLDRFGGLKCQVRSLHVDWGSLRRHVWQFDAIWQASCVALLKSLWNQKRGRLMSRGHAMESYVAINTNAKSEGWDM